MTAAKASSGCVSVFTDFGAVLAASAVACVLESQPTADDSRPAAHSEQPGAFTLRISLALRGPWAVVSCPGLLRAPPASGQAVLQAWSLPIALLAVFNTSQA